MDELLWTAWVLLVGVGWVLLAYAWLDGWNGMPPRVVADPVGERSYTRDVGVELLYAPFECVGVSLLATVAVDVWVPLGWVATFTLIIGTTTATAAVRAARRRNRARP